MKFAVYVSGKAGRLRKLIEQKSNEIFNDLDVVICDNLNNEDLELILAEKKINYISCDYISLSENKSQQSLIFSDKLKDILDENHIDYCFCFGERILKGELLNKYKNRIINFHPAILPLYPGVKAIDQAVEANTFLYGNTAHFIDETIDGGPIIMQNIVSRGMFNEFGYNGILDQQLPMLLQIYKWLKENRLEVIKGDVFIKDSKNLETIFFPRLEL